MEFGILPAETPVYIRIIPEVDRMRRLGMNFAAIATALSVDHRTVRQAVARTPRPGALVRTKSYAHSAEQVIRANPQGLRGFEIAQRIGQTSTNVGSTLRRLEAQGKITRHGRRPKALWTPAGAIPEVRIVSLSDAVIHMLIIAAEPIGGRALRDEAVKLYARHTGRKANPRLVVGAVNRLMADGVVERRGGTKRRPLYVLVSAKGRP